MEKNTFFCVDVHTCGNPVRVVAGGAPSLPLQPMSERRKIFERDFDWVRRALMFEPRGHDVMSGTILYPPSDQDCDVAVLFIEVSGCLPMCGHGTIGTVTAAVQEGLVRPRVPGTLLIEAPAGRIRADYDISDDGRVTQVRLANVASYLHAQDVEIEVAGLGRLTIDLAYGGNYYAIVESQESFAGLDSVTASDLVILSPRVRAAAQEALAPMHPVDPLISGVSHVMWCDAPADARASARNAVFYGQKAIDRSPCGTGSSARMAQLHAKGKLQVGEPFVHESIIGTLFDCHIDAETRLGEHRAILPIVGGWARVTGHNTIFVNSDDPLCHGFQLR